MSKYLIRKDDYDGRVYTHGVLLPDGYFRVMNLNLNNRRHLESMVKRGYSVSEEKQMRAGLYEEGTGKRCDEASVAIVSAPFPPNGAKVKYIENSSDVEDSCDSLGLDPRELRAKARMRTGIQPKKPSPAAHRNEMMQTLKAAGFKVSTTDKVGDLEQKMREAGLAG